MKIHDFKVGDKVIINPDIPINEKMPISDGSYLTMLEGMQQPGVFTVKEVSANRYIELNNNFTYGPTGLLHAPIYKLGDYVMISKDVSYKGWVGVIESIGPFTYTPDSLGGDGCLYYIRLDKDIFPCHNTDFELIASINKLIYQQENENQLQRKEVAVSRGDKLTGSSICCRRCKASITVGHLSYKEISGS